MSGLQLHAKEELPVTHLHEELESGGISRAASGLIPRVKFPCL